MIFQINCQIIPRWGEKEDKRPLYLALLLGLPNIANAYGRLFYAKPALFLDGSNPNLELLVPTESANSEPNRKKIIFVHGWQPNDLSSPSYPDDTLLKDRILKNLWKDVLPTNLFTLVLAKDYDIYFYTYLTSQSIEENAGYFRERMDRFFGNQVQTVTIYAHSMGGLLTRSAIIRGGYPGYIRRINTYGTPYHGSPWANSAFLGDRAVLGGLANYITNTQGGKDLSWDNFDNSIPNSPRNPFLERINEASDRDNLFYAYFSELPANGSGYAGSDSPVLASCLALGSTFSPSDCIVPVTSARADGRTFLGTRSLGAFHHIDINLKESAVRSVFIADLP